jgi:predicted DNA-binding protein with PD1-like motif
MKSQRIASEGTVDTLVVVLDNGEDAFSALQTFARNEGISAASLTAIGAFARATVG